MGSHDEPRVLGVQSHPFQEQFLADDLDLLQRELFDVLSRFYLFLGVSLIGAALLILLVRFDLPELLDER